MWLRKPWLRSVSVRFQAHLSFCRAKLLAVGIICGGSTNSSLSGGKKFRLRFVRVWSSFFQPTSTGHPQNRTAAINIVISTQAIPERTYLAPGFAGGD